MFGTLLYTQRLELEWIKAPPLKLSSKRLLKLCFRVTILRRFFGEKKDLQVEKIAPQQPPIDMDKKPVKCM